MIAEPADARTRLLALSAERKVSLAALSALLGRNSAYLQQFVRKGSPRKLEEGDRRTLAHYFGVAEAELGAPAAEAPQPANDWAEIPRLAAAASAGPGALGAADCAFDTLRFSKAWLRQQGLDPARLSAIAVSGDSMEPSLRDGDEILVEATTNPPRGAIHVVRLGESLLVKRLERPAPDRVVLLSENPAYPPVEVPAADVAVIGRVVWKSGRV